MLHFSKFTATLALFVWMTERLFTALQGAFSPDPAVRLPAAEALQTMKQQQGYATSLFQVATTSGVDQTMRVLCAGTSTRFRFRTRVCVG